MRRLSLRSLILVLLLVSAVVAPAAAQDTPAPAVEFAAGSLFFPDDGVVTERFVGGNARFYLSPRVSVGPEVAFVSATRHSHLMLTGNVSFDLLGPSAGRPARVTPFAVVGAGLFRTNEEFPFSDFSHTEGAFTAGGGVRGYVSRRIFVGAEARLGWELHLRANAFVGVTFDR